MEQPSFHIICYFFPFSHHTQSPFLSESREILFPWVRFYTEKVIITILWSKTVLISQGKFLWELKLWNCLAFRWHLRSNGCTSKMKIPFFSENSVFKRHIQGHSIPCCHINPPLFKRLQFPTHATPLVSTLLFSLINDGSVN